MQAGFFLGGGWGEGIWGHTYRVCSLLRKEATKAELGRRVAPSLITRGIAGALLFLHLTPPSLPGFPCVALGWPWICGHLPVSAITIIIMLNHIWRQTLKFEQTPRLNLECCALSICTVISSCKPTSYPFLPCLVERSEVVHTEMSCGSHSPIPWPP